MSEPCTITKLWWINGGVLSGNIDGGITDEEEPAGVDGESGATEGVGAQIIYHGPDYRRYLYFAMVCSSAGSCGWQWANGVNLGAAAATTFPRPRWRHTRRRSRRSSRNSALKAPRTVLPMARWGARHPASVHAATSWYSCLAYGQCAQHVRGGTPVSGVAAANRGDLCAGALEQPMLLTKALVHNGTSAVASSWEIGSRRTRSSSEPRASSRRSGSGGHDRGAARCCWGAGFYMALMAVGARGVPDHGGRRAGLARDRDAPGGDRRDAPGGGDVRPEHRGVLPGVLAPRAGPLGAPTWR